MTIKHPMMTWAQRASHIYLSIEVSDMKVEQLSVDGDSFKLRGTKGEDSYEADLKLYGKVKGDERRQTGTDRRVELFLPKVDAEWWPRLLSEQTKVPWIKVDFDKWADEDGGDSLSFDGSGGEDFGGIDFSNFGGTGGDTLGDLSDEDWQGDDDGDLSDAAEESDKIPCPSEEKPTGGQESSKDEKCPEEPVADEKPNGRQESSKDEKCPEEPAADEKPNGGQESSKDEVCPEEPSAGK